MIPPRGNRKEPRDYDKELYKARHLVESFFAHLKQYWGLATRYDKRATHFLSALYLSLFPKVMTASNDCHSFTKHDMTCKIF